MIRKLLKVIKENNIKKIDSLLVLSFISGLFLFFESVRLYSSNQLLEPRLPLWLNVLLFLSCVISFVVYLTIEYYKKLNKRQVFFLFVLLFLIFSQLSSIVATNNSFTILITKQDNMLLPITFKSTFNNQLIHFFAITFILISYYIGFIIIPYKIRNIKLIIFLIHIYYLVATVFLIYSLFTDDYIGYFKLYTEGTIDLQFLQYYVPHGFFGNKNTYAMFVEVGIFLGLLNFELTKKKYHIVISVLFYLHLVFLICKVGILFSTITLFAYLIYKLFYSIKKGDKKTLITLISVLGAFVIAITILIITTPLFKYMMSFINNDHSFDERIKIWQLSLDITKQTSLINGAGFGLFNYYLYVATEASGITPTPIAHSWFYSILGRGGIILLTAYILVLLYSIFIATKLYMKNAKITLVLLLAEITFFCHSFFEDNHYIAILITIAFVIFNKIYSYKEQLL